MEGRCFTVMFAVSCLGLPGIHSVSDKSLCPGEPYNQCSCNLTTGLDAGVAMADLSAEVVDWRVVILAGFTGALASTLAIIAISLMALWKADKKVTPGMGYDNPQDYRGQRPVSNTSSSSGSWAEPRKRADPIDNPRDWPDKLKFKEPDQPSPRWSHGSARVWPGADNLSTF
ncbi:hypothetical protein PoB_001585500 [Plakobranchus ocellatus]|uniref:Uncharacterized protein n=1 Tax=Plakobranchus ocellatus TaxID=259542 RepID=A0AAV3Z401_9GAST|nr:hypothetical protein PoB_001585500 [Plakobranchus ocellatus]